MRVRFPVIFLLILIMISGKGFSQAKPASTFIKYDTIHAFHDGLAAVCHDHLWGFINSIGREVIPLQYSVVSNFVEAQAVVFNDGWKVINKKGEVVRKETDFYARRFIASNDRYPTNNAMRSFVPMPQPAVAEICPPNIDFEFGDFSNWYCYTGLVSTVAAVNTITYFNNNPPANTPFNGRHTIIPASIPSAVDPYGGFPTNAPDGSSFSVKLGNDLIRDSAEKIRYVIQVPAASTDFSIIFYYAVVLENPKPNEASHTPEEKPRMIAQVIDAATGNILNCADFLYVAASNITGFYNSALDSNVKCKDWAPVFVNLSGYGGRTIYLDFITADCTKGAHFGYAYIDVGCSQLVDIFGSCDGSNTTLLYAPPGYAGYNWWDSAYTTLLGSSQILTLNPSPPLHSIFWVEVTPEAGNGCMDTIKAEIITHNPVANAGPDKFLCSPNTVPLGVTPVQGYNYQWSPPTYLSNSSVANPVTNTPSPTTYFLTVTDVGHCIAKDTVNVNVYPKPTAGFTFTAPVQCLDVNSFTFSNASIPATVSSSWNFGDGNASTAASPTHVYQSAGTYNVVLIVTTGDGCKDSIVHQVRVSPRPQVSFNINSQNQCFTGHNVVFFNNTTVSSGSLNYLWTFGDGNTSIQSGPSHIYATPGTYSIHLVATSNTGCADSVSGSVTLYPSPTVAFSLNQTTQCLGNGVIFNNGSTPGASYQWLFGDGGTSAQFTPTHTYSQPGTYQVHLFVSINSCIDSAIHTITVAPVPTVSFGINNINQCFSGNNIVLQNNSTISSGSLNYSWTFGDGNSSTQISPTHIYASAGTYPVHLFVTGNTGCIDSLVSTVNIYPTPLVGFSAAPPAQCLGNTCTFVNSSDAGMNYQWQFGDGIGSTAYGPSHIYTNPGNYIVQLNVISIHGCEDSTKHPVIIYPKPAILFSPNSASQCLQNNQVVLTNNSSIAGGTLNYNWTFGDGITSQLPAPNHVYAQTGNYSIQLVATSGNGCKDSLVHTVVIHPNASAQVNVVPRSVVCEGSSVQLHASGGVSYVWSPPGGLSCTLCNDPTVTPVNDITYSVIVTDNFNCTANASLPLRVIHPFYISAVNDTICRGDSARIAAVGANFYAWTPTTGLSNPAVSAPHASPAFTTHYTIVGSDGWNCFTDTTYSVVTVGQPLGISLGDDLSLSTGTIYHFQPHLQNGPPVSWVWSPSNELSCTTCAAPVANIIKDITYSVVIRDIYGCVAMDNIFIRTFCDNTQVFVPNAFSPDGDGVNDILMVRGMGIETVKYFRIFNRWGELVFEKKDFPPNDKNFGWDGRVRGVLAPPDVFVYTAIVICGNGTSYPLKGNVSIIR